MCCIPLLCLGLEISVVQASPRPAASTLQVLGIGKYLEGHLSKPLHAAIFIPSPHYIHTHAMFFFFFLDFEISFILFLAGSTQMLLRLFGSPPNFPPIHITSSLEHTKTGDLAVWFSPISCLALSDFVNKATFFFSYKLLLCPKCHQGSRKTF